MALGKDYDKYYKAVIVKTIENLVLACIVSFLNSLDFENPT